MEEVLEREVLCIKPKDLAFPPEHNKNATSYKPKQTIAFFWMSMLIAYHATNWDLTMLASSGPMLLILIEGSFLLTAAPISNYQGFQEIIGLAVSSSTQGAGDMLIPAWHLETA